MIMSLWLFQFHFLQPVNCLQMDLVDLGMTSRAPWQRHAIVKALQWADTHSTFPEALVDLLGLFMVRGFPSSPSPGVSLVFGARRQRDRPPGLDLYLNAPPPVGGRVCHCSRILRGIRVASGSRRGRASGSIMYCLGVYLYNT